ncbi:MAG: TolC family protein [Elusimicrobia bacterium]|nr:TolC family protein [Elusimicrobiota bacterium]
MKGPITFVLFLALLTLGAGVGRAAGETVRLEGTSVEQTLGKTRVTLSFSGPVEYRVFPQGPVAKVFIQFAGGEVVTKRGPVEDINKGGVKEIHYGRRQGGETLEYVSISLDRPASYQVSREGSNLLLTFEPTPGTPSPLPSFRTPPPPAIPVGGPLLRPPPTTRGEGSTGLTLEEARRIALRHSLKVKVAEEEVELAGIRKLDAGRDMAPSLSGRWAETNGTVVSPTEQDFRRKEIGVQVGQPIFQGGRLLNTYRQARTNREIVEHNLAKTRQTLIYEVTRAYYTVLKTQQTVRADRAALERATALWDMANRKRQGGVSSEEEWLRARSSFTQLHYRARAEERELELAQVQLQGLLQQNVPLPGELSDPLRPKRLEASLEDLLRRARRHNPELLAAELTAQFHDYGHRAAEGERWPRVDASAFYGKSAAAFQNEPLRLEPSWNIGVRGTLAFWGNSASSNFVQQKSAPDLGESTRSRSRLISATVGLWDRSVAPMKQAEVEYARAQAVLQETRQAVEVQVREAFTNYHKGLLQVEGATQDVEYRQREVEILRERQREGTAEAAQVLTAEATLRDAAKSVHEAVAFTNVALAALSRAIGTDLLTP